MARTSAAQRAGLTADITRRRDGKWKATLTDDQGTLVFDSVYGSESSAKQGIREWVRENYQEETEEVPAPPPEPSPEPRKPKSLGPSPRSMIQMMRIRADDNEARAVDMRIQAESLESEAKRLRQAADSLEGPDGPGESS